jgi:hypothetical protein
MLQKVIDKVGLCNIFWAKDFKDYSGASAECYSEIANITNYYLFSCENTLPESNQLWYNLNIYMGKILPYCCYYRLPNSGCLGENLYQKYHVWKSPKLFAAMSVTGTLAELHPTMWKQIAANQRQKTEIKTFNQMGFPTPIKDKHMEQISNVFNKIIFPGQFLPQLFNNSNYTQILDSGQHISEVYLTDNHYTALTRQSVLQHCRQYGMQPNGELFGQHR